MAACQLCDSPIPEHFRSDARYCSGYCRNKASHLRRATYPVICPWCKKATTFNISDIRRGRRHCSKSCAKRAHSAEVAVPELDAAFGHWLAGFTDGEGHFGFRVGKHTKVVFTVGLRADDGDILEVVKTRLGFGRIYRERRAGHDLLKYQCVNIRECSAIVSIFRQFPLRSKKARDFSIWTEAIEAMLDGENHQDTLSGIAARLKAVRNFTSGSVEPAIPEV